MTARLWIIAALLVAGCSSDPTDNSTQPLDAGTSDDVSRNDDQGSAGDDGAAPDVSGDASTDEPDMNAVQTGWVDRALLPAPQQEIATVVIDGLMYVMGGFSETAQQLPTVVVYDPDTDSWSGRADFPTRANHMNAVVVDGEIWVTGFLSNGFNADGRTFVYSPAEDAWRPGPDLPAGRARGASAVGAIGGEIYVVGGIGESGANAMVDVLDPDSGVWASLGDAPRAFDHAGFGVIDDKLYVAAGRNGSIPSFVDDVHVFDPATGEWTDLAPIPTARGGVASAVFGGKLYVFGGEGNPAVASGVFDDSEVYDPATDTWTVLDPMPQPRHGFAGAALGNAIHLPGGAPTEFLDATDVHDALIPGD